MVLCRRRFVIVNLNIFDWNVTNPFENVGRHRRLSRHHAADRLGNRFAPGDKSSAVLSALGTMQGLSVVLLRMPGANDKVQIARNTFCLELDVIVAHGKTNLASD